MATPPSQPSPDSSGIHLGDVGGSVNFSALGDIVGGDKITTITTTIQISVEAITQRPLITASPYRGLDRFEDRDKDLFFGRDQLIKGLLAQLSASNVLLVLGASGSGKSSVARAGLLPQLAQLIGARFRYFTFVPDVNPFESLRSALQGAGFSQAQTRELGDALPETPAKLIHTLQRNGDQWLFFVDQFEEIFTVGDEKLRASFIAALTQIAQDTSGSTKLVLAMRADFLDRFSPFPQFAKIIEKNIDFVADMHPDELRLAIEQPAARHGVVFEQGLVEEIIKDVQGQAGSLPLLQYSLDLLWQEEARKDGLADRHLNTRAYRELGGVRGALQKRADEIYASFGDGSDAKAATPKQATVRQIFLRLVDLTGEGSNDAAWRPVRRRASMAMFTTTQEQEILQSLINQKLLVSNREGDDATVEVAHEALFTSWGRLKNWIEAGKQVIFARNRLADDARRWQRHQQEDAAAADEELFSGTRLAQALDMRARGDFFTIVGGLGESETQFLDASAALRDRRRQEEQGRQRRELEAAQKLADQSTARLQAEEKARREAEQRSQEQLLANSRLRKRGLALLALVVAAIGLAALAWTSQRRAGEEAEKGRQTFSRSDFIRAADFLDQGETAKAIAYLSRALDTRPENHAAADRIFNLLTQRRFYLPLTEPLKVEGKVGAVRFTAEGGCLIAVVNGKIVQVWDTQEQRVRFAPLVHESFVSNVQFSENGKLLAVACGVQADDAYGSGATKPRGYAQVWDAQTGRLVAGPLLHDGPVLSVCFNKSGDRIVTASEDKTARIWDTASGKQVGDAIQHKAPVLTAEFSADGQRIVTASGELAVWNVGTGAFVCSAKEKADASYLFSIDDFQEEGDDDADAYRQAVRLVKKLQAASDPLSELLWSRFSPEARPLLADPNLTNVTKHRALTAALVDELNKVLSGPSIYEDKRFPKGQLSSETLALKAQNPQGKELIRLNRLLLNDAYALRATNQAKGISVKFSPAGKQVVGVLTSSDGDGHVYEFVRIFDASNGRPIGDPKSKNFDFSPGIFGGVVTSIDFITNGSDLAVSYAGSSRLKDDTGYALRLSCESGEALGEPYDHKHPVDCVRFGPERELFITACEDGLVRFWDAGTEGLALASVPLKLETPPRFAQFSADKKRLLVVSEDPAAVNPNRSNFILQIYSMSTRLAGGEMTDYAKPKATTEKTATDNVWLAINADGTRAIKKTERSATLCDAKTGQPMAPPLPVESDLGDKGEMLFAKFSPDGKCFVTGIGVHKAVGRGSARLWDGFTGRPLREPLRHDRSVIGAAFSPDSQRLLTVAATSEAGEGCAPRMWDVQTGRPLSDPLARVAENDGISADAAEFIEDGRRVRLTSSNDEVAQIRDVGLPPNARIPTWLSYLARLVGGYELNPKSGIIEPVPNRLEGLRHLHQQLTQSEANDPYVIFGKWVLSDPATRTISPYSKISPSPKP